MKVGFVQLDVSRCWKQNLLQIRRALEEDCPELVVLPELCDGGYLYPGRPTLLETAQPLTESPFVQGIQAMSWEFGCTMVFGTTERDQDRVYNTAAVTSHGALMGRYRKMHLSRLEQTLFDPGDSPVVVEAAGVKLGLGICFDLWFPEFTRELRRQGAELLCFPANFGGEATARIAPVRAMENLTPLLLCNRIGAEQLAGIDAEFRGASMVISAEGELLSGGGLWCACTGSAEIQPGQRNESVMCKDFDWEIARHTAVRL